MNLFRLLAGATLGLAATSAWCVANVTVQLGVNPNFSGGTGPFNQTITQAGPANLVSGLVTGGFSSSGTGHVFTDIGNIKLDGTSVGSLNSLARGIWRDDLKIDLAGVAPGTLVTVDFWINVAGTLAVNDHNGAAVSWQLRADVGGGAFDLGADAQLFNNSPSFAKHGYFGTPLGLLHGTATVGAGQLAPLDIEFSAVAQTSYDGHNDPILASASFDFSHTVTWAGMAVSLNGISRPDAIVTSTSGLNYLQAAPVPEPGSGVMAVAGVLLLLSRRRRP